MSIVIRNGTIVTAQETRKADLLIEGDRISAVGPGLVAPTDSRVIDATGMYVIPGGIDAHTHLDMPFGGTMSSDDFETGTRAAAFGGTTSIVDFAIQSRGMRMREALDIWMKKAEGRATIDYGLHMIVTDLGGCGLEDMDDMVREGVASFKLFMAYPNVLMVDDGTIFKAMAQTAKNGALICMHAENGSVIDVIVARAVAEGKRAPVYHALSLYITEGVFLGNPLLLLIIVAIGSLGLWGTINFLFGGKATYGSIFTAWMYAGLPGIFKVLLGIIVIFAGTAPESF